MVWQDYWLSFYQRVHRHDRTSSCRPLDIRCGEPLVCPCVDAAVAADIELGLELGVDSLAAVAVVG